MKKLIAVLSVIALIVAAFLGVSVAEALFTPDGRELPRALGLTVFFLVIVTEVVLAPVPGGVISFLASGYFGFYAAWPVIYVGNLIGSSIAFKLAERWGQPIVDRMTSEKDRDRYNQVIAGHPGLLWLVYLLPVFPIDVISFLCGFSALTYRRWFPIMATGMVVYSLVVSSVGAYFGQFIPWIGGVSAVVTVVFFVLVIFFALSLRRDPVPEAPSSRPGDS